jgi:hypothetical protein
MAAFTTIDDPSAYFQTALYTGNANYNTITNDGNSDLGPDFIWGKCRSTTKLHFLYDTTRGTEKRLESDNTGVEDIFTNGVLNFYTDGFRLGSGNTENDNTESYVAWQWKANGGTTSSNTAGTITSTVQANTTAGFSIITWTGTGSVGTIGHGLGVAPTFLMVKNRTTTLDWAIYHKNMIDAGYTLAINNDDGQVDSGTNRWNHTSPTSSVIHIGAGQQTNQNTNSMLCYAFAEKQGYSKFGKYVGNSSTDGPFVYTGFKPAFVLQKQISGNGNGWFITDSRRDPFNAATGKYLRADESGAEGTTGKILDLLSNGFKVRNSDSALNGSNHTYIYMAFAENPFTTSTGVPACAK